MSFQSSRSQEQRERAIVAQIGDREAPLAEEACAPRPQRLRHDHSERTEGGCLCSDPTLFLTSTHRKMLVHTIIAVLSDNEIPSAEHISFGPFRNMSPTLSVSPTQA